ncbi:hypothetical protein SCLCIDRAFT_1214345 [Scleroderma citrinum Foug A]|uniref:Uncharacterized protein n=1 Tax=Scleroderma citrinum Foug A TaxID=1036808 RepID=A0A0C3AE78_9AGAM|nr:hypothetical protein SCLCIDRAFT_1214345 [Scleroderma citrinum Foug A]
MVLSEFRGRELPEDKLSSQWIHAHNSPSWLVGLQLKWNIPLMTLRSRTYKIRVDRA